MTDTLLLALSWNPQVRGGLYVLLAVLVLCGSGFLILSTNLGGRLGFQAAAAGLMGFMVLIGMVWWVYGIGPQGEAPTWVPRFVVQGDLGQAGGEILAGFPRDWEQLDLTDPAVADALPVADGELTGGEAGGGVFQSAADYLPVAALEKGGETYGPFGILNFRPLDLFHKPHYLIIQVQGVIEQEAVPGAAPPRPQVDPNATPAAVVMVRDLGSLRLNPAIFTIASTLLFGLLVYQLHTRDKELMALQAKE
ncbi:MAG TPA: hypothetical protein VHF91_06440 [Acidimicrobiales bacterium]|nr:hypothetical protein [Acidimicrobiales bacterium]